MSKDGKKAKICLYSKRKLAREATMTDWEVFGAVSVFLIFVSCASLAIGAY